MPELDTPDGRLAEYARLEKLSTALAHARSHLRGMEQGVRASARLTGLLVDTIGFDPKDENRLRVAYQLEALGRAYEQAVRLAERYQEVIYQAEQRLGERTMAAAAV